MNKASLLASVVALLSATTVSATDIKFALDWKFEGPAAPYLMAMDRGYYEEEGLNVSIDTGAGSLEAIPRVASGTYQLGFADINSLIKFRDQDSDVPVQAIMMVYDAPPFAIVGRKSLGVEVPSDLEGRTLGAPATDGAFAQWPAFVQVNDLDTDQITIENVGFPVREPMLAQGDVDAITGFSFSSYINLKSKGVDADDITVMLMTDYGLKLYGNAIIVNPTFAEENPEAVTAFLRATIRGWRDTIADPEAAVEYVLAHNSIARKEVELERLIMSIDDNILTDAVVANGMGDIDPERMREAIDQIGIAYSFNNKPEVDDIFTDAYLPSDAERMLQ
ncbi:ABC transporter substrate-binding protein [Saccharospirillum impatiens]|uniref:ABC transporter substrate-binding protein n=1 Tax=Saccharospirillum impatiens TaxID=169438 RepID=UPI0003FDA90E|nr:ABC transporter substrate-binding protein [Saccharospirillum impatiens]